MTLKIQNSICALRTLFLAESIALITLLFELPAPAQTTSGLMRGIISDSSEEIVPSAEVAIINQGTDQVRIWATGDNGVYLIVQLPPGAFGVSVKKQGFATETGPDVQLEGNQSVTNDFKLEISSTHQALIVTRAASQPNTPSPTLSDVIDHVTTAALLRSAAE
jgi:hypothetical protein